MSEEERRQLLSALHSRLFWVGQRIPNHVEVEGKDCPLHEYVWELIRKDEITPEEKEQIDNCIKLISGKEEEDEKELEEMALTRDEARTLYHETAGLLRAIMDLRDIEDGSLKERTKHFQEKFADQRVRDAKLWLEFLKEVKK
ncbi:DUF5788 family protein [Methanosarcina sp. Mfa9]|uniref:DUF5788 family protein n=1 Tax=Methanosarcina sp. Mfa9 TaxID=3439063 RepID=UPI003F84FD8C